MSPQWRTEHRTCVRCNGRYPMVGFYTASSSIRTRTYKSWVCRLCRQTVNDRRKSENRFRDKTTSVIRREGRRLADPDRLGGPLIEAPGDLVSIYGWTADRLERLLRHAFEGECIGCEAEFDEMPHGLANLTLDIREPDQPPWLESNVQFLCATCNKTKQRLSGPEWGEYLHYVRLWKEQRALMDNDPGDAGFLFRYPEAS